MREILINTWAVGGIAIGITAGSLTLSTATGDPQWFARSGSIMTVFGLLLLVKHSVLCAGADLESAMMEKLHYRRGHAPPVRGTVAYERDLSHTRRILMDEFGGFTMSLIGTVIWGYGDLLLRGLGY
ncbi:hypothetical protein [Halofilum ochraceum]|uniref:hypothetical protein n=1 Tax=Halofilum ochraceum TaxID=1611323 RepID=UPI0008DA06DB|nr:hypothetical protein [Halofilum ochraceum]